MAEKTLNRLSLALLHYPVVDRMDQLYTTAITNMDVHDIARSSCTYGLNQYYVVSPILAQREMAETMASFWVLGSGQKRNTDRAQAMSLVKVHSELSHCVENEKKLNSGRKTLLIATSAKRYDKSISYAEGKKLMLEHDVMLIFGTGFGLAPQVIDEADYVLEPIYGAHDYNHLSVRSAAAIILDRLCSRTVNDG